MSDDDYAANIEARHSHEGGQSVRQIIAETTYNEAEIVPAPRELLDQLGQQYINNLETIPVTPEAPWDEEGEKLLHYWMDEAITNATKQQRAGFHIKSIFRGLKFMVIALSVIVFLLTALFGCNAEGNARVVTIVFTALNMLGTQIETFLNYGPRYQLHFEYEGHYEKLAIDIRTMLHTDVDFRPPKDRTLMEYRERRKQLIMAPEVK